MSTALVDGVRTATTVSADGTTIAYHTLGQGPGLVIVGGVLWDGSDYLPLARALAHDYQVHVMERRARPGSGPQREHHGIDDECTDLVAVAATGAYCYSLSSRYNLIGRPAVVAVRDGRARLILRRETVDDLLSLEMR